MPKFCGVALRLGLLSWAMLAWSAAASAADVPIHIVLRGGVSVLYNVVDANPVVLQACPRPGCTVSYPEGTRLRFGPYGYYGLHHWEGACSGTTPACEVTITAETTVIAQFSFRIASTFSGPETLIAPRGSPYSASILTLSSSGFIPDQFPMTFSMGSGTLPPGISMSSAGLFTGTPTALGRFTFTVDGVDALENISSTTINFDVNREWLITTGADAGGWAHVRTFRPGGVQDPGPASSFFAYAPPFGSGVRVAVGDVNQDAAPDVITAPGPGSALVRIVDGATGVLIREFDAFSWAPPDGVYVAAGDVNGDGVADVIAGAGGPPVVRIFNGRDGALLREFVADTGTGARVAAGDVNGDGYDDIVVGAGPGSTPWVRVYDGTSGALLRSILPYGPPFTGGVYVAAGQLDYFRGHADIVTGAGSGGAPHVRVYDGVTGAEKRNFFPYPLDFPGGVRVAVGDVDGDRWAEIITSAGPGGGPHVRAFKVRIDGFTITSLPEVDGFFAYPGFGGGVFVAAPTPLRRMSVDAPLPGSTVPASSTLFGWAVYERASQFSLQVGAVHVWAHPVDGGAARFVGYSIMGEQYGIARPDLAAVLGGSYTRAGFEVSLATLPPGTYDLVVYALQSFAGAPAPVNRRVVRVTIQ